MANPWFRMYSEFSHDPKVQMLSESMQRRYIMLMCLHCSDSLVTLQDQEVAFHIRISNEDLAETKALFIAKGFIDSKWNLLNWEKRQFISDTSKARVAKHRALQKEKQKTDGNGDVTLQKRNGNALDTEQNRTESDKNTSSSQMPDCPHESLISLYAEHLPMLPQPRISLWRKGKNAPALKSRWAWVMTECYETGERKGTRMATNRDEGLEWFGRFFGYVAGSDFLTGRDGKWSADLGWLVNSANFEKVISGNYENKEYPQ